MNNTLQSLNEIDNCEIAKSFSCNIESFSKHYKSKNSILTIASQNIRSIYCNLDDLTLNLLQLKLDIDIIVLTECRIDKDKPIPNMTNYTKYSTTIHLNQSDGVVVFVKNNVQASVNEILLKHASCIQVTTGSFTIICIYRSPSNRDATPFILSLENTWSQLRPVKTL